MENLKELRFCIKTQGYATKKCVPWAEFEITLSLFAYFSADLSGS